MATLGLALALTVPAAAQEVTLTQTCTSLRGRAVEVRGSVSETGRLEPDPSVGVFFPHAPGSGAPLRM